MILRFNHSTTILFYPNQQKEHVKYTTVWPYWTENKVLCTSYLFVGCKEQFHGLVWVMFSSVIKWEAKSITLKTENNSRTTNP